MSPPLPTSYSGPMPPLEPFSHQGFSQLGLSIASIYIFKYSSPSFKLDRGLVTLLSSFWPLNERWYANLICLLPSEDIFISYIFKRELRYLHSLLCLLPCLFLIRCASSLFPVKTGQEGSVFLGEEVLQVREADVVHSCPPFFFPSSLHFASGTNNFENLEKYNMQFEQILVLGKEWWQVRVRCHPLVSSLLISTPITPPALTLTTIEVFFCHCVCLCLCLCFCHCHCGSTAFLCSLLCLH